MSEALLGISREFLKEYHELVGERLSSKEIEKIDAKSINEFIAKWQFTLRSLELGTTFSVKEDPKKLIETKMGVLSILDYAREITEQKIRLLERYGAPRR